NYVQKVYAFACNGLVCSNSTPFYFYLNESQDLYENSSGMNLTYRLKAYRAPKINSFITIPASPYYNISTFLEANVTDPDPDTYLVSVNFTLIAPNGSEITGINYTNGTHDGLDIWNSSSHITHSVGVYTYYVNMTNSIGVHLSRKGSFYTGVTVNLNLPVNNNNSVSLSDNITFNCSAIYGRNLSMITLYLNMNKSLGWSAYMNQTVSGTQNSTIFTVDPLVFLQNNTFIDSSYEWNCLANATDSSYGLNGTNFTFSAWDFGSYDNTTLNANNISLKMNSTNQYENSTGTYTSQVFSAPFKANWKNISWDEMFGFYNKELPNYMEDETLNYSYGINMSGNFLLLHFNNDSAYENSTYVYDWSGNDNNGTWYGTGRSNATGKFGSYSGWFDGDSDYVNVPNLDNKNITFTAWVKRGRTSSAGNDRLLLSVNSNGWGVGFNTDNTVFFTKVGISSVSSTKTVADTTNWHHMAMVYNGSNACFYFDGIKYTCPSYTVTFDSSGGAYTIGSRGTAEYFKGTIDEVAIWNRSLSAAEIQNIYKRGVLRLNLSARSCQNAGCAEEFINFGSNATFTNISYLRYNQYFQYKLDFETDNANLTPELDTNSVRIGYDRFIEQVPAITKLYPNRTLGESADASNMINFSINEPNSQIFNITYTNNSMLIMDWYIDGRNQLEYQNKSEFIWTGNDTQAGSYIIIVNISNDVGYDYKTWNMTVNDTSINISINFTPHPVNINSTVVVSGHINLTNGTNVENTSINIYFNGNRLSGAENWFDSSWNYRTIIQVDTGYAPRGNNTVVKKLINFTSLMLDANISGNLDNNSIRVIDQFGREMDSGILRWIVENSTGMLRWKLSTNETIAKETNFTYYIYFDTVENGIKQAPNYNLPKEYAIFFGGDAMTWNYYAYKNDNCSFGSLTTIESGVEHNDGVIADFDNDGDYDYIMTAGLDGAGGLDFMQNNGDESWSFTKSDISTQRTDWGGYGVCDFDEDGYLDIATGFEQAANLNVDFYVLFNDGDGTFTETLKDATTSFGDSRAVGCGDFDGDNNADVVMGGASVASLDFWFGNGDGTFSTRTSIGVTGTNPHGIWVVDNDKDGDDDIYYTDNTNAYRIESDGDRTFSSSQSQTAYLATIYGGGSVTDCNNDGLLDLTHGTWTATSAYVHYGNGAATDSFDVETLIATLGNTNSMNWRLPDYVRDINTTLSSDVETVEKTNATGYYTYNLTTPLTPGNYNVTVNLTYKGLFGTNTKVLTVVLPPPNITKLYPNRTKGNYYDPAEMINFSINEPINITFNISYTGASVTINWSVDGRYITAYNNKAEFNWSGNYTQQGNYIVIVNVSNLGGYSQKSWNMTVNNTDIPPTSTMNAPSDNNHSVSLTGTIIFNCSGSDSDSLANVTLYSNLNVSAGWSGIANKSFIGTANSTTFSINAQSLLGAKTFLDSSFIWNCLVCDSLNNCSFAVSNLTFSGWDLGKYNKTDYNMTDNTITLTANDTLQELPNNMGHDGFINMSGNVLLMHFNNDSDYENSTHVYDWSGNDNNGTLLGTARSNGTAQFGNFGGSFRSEGADHINITSFSQKNNESFSVVAWIKISTALNNYNGIISNLNGTNGGWSFHILNNKLRSSGGISLGATTLTVDQWYHVGYIFNGSHEKIYLNAQIDSNYIEHGYTSQNMLTIGRANGAVNSYFFNGTIDELAIWNRSLSAEEILNIYNRQKGKYIDRGNYTSKVFNATYKAAWKNISWDVGFNFYNKELPGNMEDETLCVAENSLITMADKTKKKITDVKPGEYVLSLDENTGKLVSNKVKALLDMGTKPIYELKTASKRSINTTGNHPYLVKLYEKEKCDYYAGDVWNKEYNYFENGYCTRWVRVSELKENMEVAVPKNTKQDDLSLISRIMMLKSKKDNSFVSIINFKSEDKASKDMNSSFTSRIIPQRLIMIGVENNLLNLLGKNALQERMFFTGFDNLSLAFWMNNTEIAHSSKISSTEFSLIKGPFLLDCSSLTNSSFKGSSSTGCQSIFLQNSQSSSDIVPVFIYSSNISFFKDTSLATSDQLIQLNLFNRNLSSVSIGTITLDIYNSPLALNLSSFTNLSFIPSLITSGQLISGRLSNLSLSSLGIENVTLSILYPPHHCVDIHKCVKLFKSFDSEYHDILFEESNKDIKFEMSDKLSFSKHSQNSVIFEQINSITEHEPQHVYDLEIENTHNFIANDIIAHNTYTDGVNMSGNVLLMHFNNDSVYENSTHVYDWSGNDNNGTWYGGGRSNSTGKLGAYSGYFDGNDDYANINSIVEGLAPTTTGTWSAWIKADGFNSAGGRIISIADTDAIGYLEFSNTGDLNEFQASARSSGGVQWDVESDEILETNKWYHVVLVQDGAEPDLYINGEDAPQHFAIGDDKTIWASDLSVQLDNANIGDLNFNGNGIGVYNWNGTIDEVAIWNRSLSAEEILNIYKRGVLRLNLSARSCDDPFCDTETFTNFGSNHTLTDTSGLTSNQYFQYKFNFETDDANYTPQLTTNSVTIKFEDAPPNITKVYPNSTMGE
ncbi:MAG: LamG-like jellyroll fold domain-containing protein, partial [Nanoarchaeota archaeon]